MNTILIRPVALFCMIALAAVNSTAQAKIILGSKDLGSIWFVGDSITQSNGDGDANGSPRKSLYDKLVAGGYTFNYTGHSTANTDGLPASGTGISGNLYHYHSGVSGSTIGANTGGRTDMTANIPTWWTGGTSRLSVAKPNVILIMLGTNDINNGLDLPNAPARVTTLINTIYAQSGVGDPTIFLASIPPNRTTVPTDPVNTATFNAEIPGIVQSFKTAGKDIYFVDQFTDIENNYASAMMTDNLHPNATGNNLMAERWYTAIQAQAVPEPSVMGMILLSGLACLRRGRR